MRLTLFTKGLGVAGCVLAICMTGASFHGALAQVTAGGTRSGAQLRGYVGFSGEAYLASGISNRRDATSGTLFGRAASNGSPLGYGFQFLLASEQTGTRQAINRFTGNLNYRFVRLTAGDFSPVLSRFSVNGTTLRGGAIEFTPGPAVATFMLGRIRRSVADPGTNRFVRPSFREWIYSVRMGVGRAKKTHLHVIGIVARDAEGSLADSLGLAPTENVSITPDAGLSVLNDRLELRASYTLSAFTADTRARESDSGVPGMLGFFTPRAGSRIDYAAELFARLRLREFHLRTSYERVQPGFRSLGLTQTRSDQAIFRVEPTAFLADRNVTLSGRFWTSRNNLEGNRSATLRRRLLGLHSVFRLSSRANLLAAYSNLASTNDLDESALLLPISDQKNVAQTFIVGPTVSIAAEDRTHVLAVNVTYQFLRDKSASTPDGNVFAAEFDNVTTTAAHTVAFESGLSVNSSVGFLSSRTPTTRAGAINLALGAGSTFQDRRGQLNLTAGWSRNTLDVKEGDFEGLGSTQLTVRFTGSYRLQSGSRIRLVIRGLRNSGDLTPSFREMQTSIRFEHRF